MRVHKRPRKGPHLVNRLGRLAAARGLSEAEVAQRAALILGRPLDRRTVRHYLNGEAIEDSTMAVVAALAGAIGVPLGEAISLEREETVDDVLARAGIRVYAAQRTGPVPPDFWRVDPAWGDLVGPFLEDRHSDEKG